MFSSRNILLTFIAATIVAGMGSCKKITQDQLINGLWEVTNVEIDTSTTNFLETHLPHYANGNNCCAYKLDFEKDNTVIAYYITNDSFNRYDLGYWEATAYKEVYIQVDSFLDGTFKITQPTIKTRKLTSEENYIPALQDTLPTMFEMKKI